jgi:hypothetical protein
MEASELQWLDPMKHEQVSTSRFFWIAARD